MKIEIDNKPTTGGGFSGRAETAPFAAIRLYPETNKEMAQMEWILKVKKDKATMKQIVNGGNELHYAIIFGK